MAQQAKQVKARAIRIEPLLRGISRQKAKNARSDRKKGQIGDDDRGCEEGGQLPSPAAEQRRPQNGWIELGQRRTRQEKSREPITTAPRPPQSRQTKRDYRRLDGAAARKP